MPFVIDDANLPAVLTAQSMTDQEFEAFCASHPDLNFEMSAEGELIVMAPTHFLTGSRNNKISSQLELWSQQDGRGIACDSSTGFVLPNGARRSPDASWTLKSRIRLLDPSLREGFLHLCPDFVIELQSKSDRPRLLREKMMEYITNGATLGWLIDPRTQSVAIFRSGSEPEVRTGIDSLSAEGDLATFTLTLTRIWDPGAE